jgi:phosphate-selective porin OprO/OprP
MNIFLISVLALQAPASAADPQESVPAAAPVPAVGGELPLEVFFRDGLRFRTKDGNFDSRIGGRMLAQYRWIHDRPDDETPGDGLRSVPDLLFVRQARMEIEGLIMKQFFYKVQVDMSTGLYNQSTGAGPSGTLTGFRDAYIEWSRFPEFTVRVGQFLQPVSQEDFCTTRFIELIERSNSSRLMLGREVGLMAGGELFDRRLEYRAVVTQGQALIGEMGRNVSDSNDEKELLGIIRVYPFKDSEIPWLEKFRVALGGSLTDVDSTPGTNLDLVSTELSILWLNSDAGLFDGRRWRCVPQASWSWGPSALRFEAFVRGDKLASGSPVDEIRSRGWYLQASHILTGETKVLEDRIVPDSEWGALEIAARYGAMKIDDVFSSGLASRDGNTDAVRTWTGGLNWWLTRNVRLSGNLVWERYADPLAFDGRREDSIFGALFRAQVDF